MSLGSLSLDDLACSGAWPAGADRRLISSQPLPAGAAPAAAPAAEPPTMVRVAYERVTGAGSPLAAAAARRRGEEAPGRGVGSRVDVAFARLRGALHPAALRALRPFYGALLSAGACPSRRAGACACLLACVRASARQGAVVA